jgi:hypothetical protein
MDVYLVPTGVERYELYCEVPDEPVSETETEADPPRGVIQRLRHRFTETIAEAERQRRHGRPSDEEAGWMSRTKARVMRWVAESIAEQRLLWHMRHQTAACLFHPDDVDASRAVAVLRGQLGHDYDRHRKWLIIDSLGLIASGLLMLVPGPNLLAYYFAFRLVGHYLSMRGARCGLDVVAWRTEESAPLAELRRAIGLEGEQREQQVTEIAAKLHLEHLASFFQRTAVAG